ncbi:hypothetical protein ACFQ9V_10035 [Leifsonia sp. NPDC056665]|uniref:hypothetical protein n=1 Tax=Leifsonia sp. NPDC056665 TaxID=3345901 RepID=UPI0036BA801D
MGIIQRVACMCAAIVTVMAALSGCAGQGSRGEVSQDRPITSPSPAPTPAGSMSLDCDRLFAPAELAGLLGPVHTASGSTSEQGLAALADVDRAAARGPLALIAVGGAECVWTHGDSRLTVQVLPHAADSWAGLADAYAHAAAPGAAYAGGESRGGDCVVFEGGGMSCHTNVLVGEAWLAVEVSSVSAQGATEASFHDAVQRMLPAVAEAAASAPAAATGPVPACGADDLRRQQEQAFGRPAITNMGVEETFRIEAAVLQAGATGLCEFQPSADGSGGWFSDASVLRRASNVFEAHTAAARAVDPAATTRTITVGGRSIPVLLWHRTFDITPLTTADALIDGAWLQYRTVDPNDDGAVAMMAWLAGRI